MTGFGALEGLRVLDLTQMLAGPYATQLLADQGADVVKVEPPGGDMTRQAGPFRPEDTARAFGGYYLSINRNKRSICLDLKDPSARDVFLTLVDSADVVVENFRAGVMERLGLAYEVLAARNPRLVYASIRGFGDARGGDSPYRDWPAFDVVAQAMGGVMGITGPGVPTKVGPGIGDIGPALFAAFGIMSAAWRAQRTGKGQYVDVAMADCMLALCERILYQNSIQGIVPGPEGNHHPFISPFGMFPARDGFVTIATPSDAFWRILCERLELAEWGARPEFADGRARAANRKALEDGLSARTAQLTKAELGARLGGQVPFGPVLDAAEIVAEPHYAAREMVVSLDVPGLDQPVRIAGVPVRMTDTPGRVAHAAPRLGQDTRAVLAAAGIAPDRIDALAASGAISCAA
ncbi:CaiB/BaiF CoA transferase family protein [Zavarzinia sp. CC-PAN008]|uniref:CaiB/BaiF CoA transferase family protein n=1 Tax=Zavarzinia sp. CC-PAN008 TaxID=3243332 RepID=UPI003F746032